MRSGWVTLALEALSYGALLSMSMAFAYGSVALGIVLFVVDVAVVGCAMRRFRVEMGAPGQQRGQVAVDICVFLPLALAGVVLGYMARASGHFVLAFPALGLAAVVHVCGQRCSFVAGLALAMVLLILFPTVMEDDDAAGLLALRMLLANATVKMLVSLFIVYSRDQNVFVASTLQKLTIGAIIIRVHFRSGVEVWSVMVCLLGAYLVVLYARRCRRLPAGLQGVGFVRLSYLRKLVASGQTLPRRQEVPPEAFGDPRRANQLVIASHRWLSRLKCDVCTEDFPSGLRLTTMVQRLDEFFSVKGFLKGRGFRGRLRRVRASATIGSEVLIFFDWMSLPQVSIDDNGNLTQRTKEEESLFRRALPNLPTLYSNFDVFVFSEVPDGVSSYEASGWCYAEWTIAALGQRLDFFSADVRIRSTHSDFTSILAALGNKSFTINSDREVVASLLSDFCLKRTFVDAIRKHDDAEVESILNSLQQQRKEALLECIIDDVLNTPLHVAVSVGAVGATGVLLEQGANPYHRNLRGDTASQFFLMPRLNRAARLLRTTILSQAIQSATFSWQLSLTENQQLQAHPGNARPVVAVDIDEIVDCDTQQIAATVIQVTI